MKKKPQNWIQGLSLQERKKHGITTVMSPVMPGDEGFGEFLDDGIATVNSTGNEPFEVFLNKDSSVHYSVGQVDVEVNQSHMNKLRVLHMTMHDWKKNNFLSGQYDSRVGRMFQYEADLHKVEELVERGTKTMLEDDKEFLGTDQFLTKDEMLDMNVLFKAYGGKRVTND